MHDELGIAVRHREAGRGSAAPDQRVAETIAVERQRRVEIRDAQADAIDFPDQGLHDRSPAMFDVGR